MELQNSTNFESTILPLANKNVKANQGFWINFHYVWLISQRTWKLAHDFQIVVGLMCHFLIMQGTIYRLWQPSQSESPFQNMYINASLKLLQASCPARSSPTLWGHNSSGWANRKIKKEVEVKNNNNNKIKFCLISLEKKLQNM
jgi:hypothetical protein